MRIFPSYGRACIIGPVDTLRCTRCNKDRDSADNFCRNCGLTLTPPPQSQLPVVRPAAAVTTARPAPTISRSIVRSVAVLAFGTGLELVTRRLMGSAAKSAGRALTNGVLPRPSRNAAKSEAADEVTINELVYIRKISLRR